MASSAFVAACQGAGGIQHPAASANQSIACTCGNATTSLPDFMANDYVSDKTGNSFKTRCTTERTAAAAQGGFPTSGSPVPPAPVPPSAPGSPGSAPPALTPAQQQAAAAAFKNGCQAQVANGAFYFDVSMGADEPQCLCGDATITLSYFEADTVAGFLAYPNDAQASAFQAACKAAINAFNIAGTATSGVCGCQLETDFPTCDGCVVHDWCVLRDASGSMIAYTDRTLVDVGQSNTDCSSDCPYLASTYAAACSKTTY